MLLDANNRCSSPGEKSAGWSTGGDGEGRRKGLCHPGAHLQNAEVGVLGSMQPPYVVVNRWLLSVCVLSDILGLFGSQDLAYNMVFRLLNTYFSRPEVGSTPTSSTSSFMTQPTPWCLVPPPSTWQDKTVTESSEVSGFRQSDRVTPCGMKWSM